MAIYSGVKNPNRGKAIQQEEQPLQENNKKNFREVLEKWLVGWPLLRKTAARMQYTWCTSHETVLKNHGLLKRVAFIEGCKPLKSESICYQVRHISLQYSQNAKVEPNSTPANVALHNIHKQYGSKLYTLFRNAHLLAKHRKP